MAIATYTTDLNLIANGAAADSGTWAELSGHTSGGAAGEETTYYIQGATCMSQTTGVAKGTTVGIQYDSLSDCPWVNGYCVFMWHIYLSPNAVSTWALGGIRIGVGSTTGNMRYWNSIGNDFGKYPYGGWQNIAVDPSKWAGAPDGAIDGAPVAGSYRVFGSNPNLDAAVSKGNPHGVDVIRYGRGEIYLLYGEGPASYGTFAVCASINDIQATNRWGLFQQEGTGYLWKGLMSFGKNASVCDFRDANRVITIDNTPRTYTTFNRIEINNADSSVYWDNINFSALSTAQLSRGCFEMINNAKVTMINCSFTDMSTFIFQSNATVINTTFRRCNQVTQGGASFDSCIFANASSGTGISVRVNNLALVSGCTFDSDGRNHAMELTSDCSGGTYSMSDFTFTDYATIDGNIGNEAIYNNSGGLVTLSVTSGDTPTIRNSVDSSTVFSSSSTLSLTVTDEAGSPIRGVFTFIDNKDPSVAPPYIMNSSTNTLGVASVTWTGGAVADATWRARKYGYKAWVASSPVPATGTKDIPVTMIIDPQQI